MSKRKDIIRVGDRVKIVVPNVVIRVGYPLTKAAMMKKQTPEQLQAIRDMMRAFNTVVYPEKESDFISAFNGNQVAVDRLYEKVRYIMAGRMLEQARFGGKERRIHTYNLKAIKGKLATVDARRVVKTGDYEMGTSYQGIDGDYDYDPSYLRNEKSHVLYKLYVDGYGSWWSEARDNDTYYNEFADILKDDHKDIEIEQCNLVKVDPKSNPSDDEEEHPSGLSGEHNAVLDAIHQNCLRGR